MTARQWLLVAVLTASAACAAARPAPLSQPCQDAFDQCMARCRPASGLEARPTEASGLRAHDADGTRPAVETAPCEADCHRDARDCH